MSEEIRTRFAPSPTGFLHIGGLRTALYNFLWAKKNNGKFLLRIEDTDKTREVPGAAADIENILKRFNLIWDDEPVYQSTRLEKYKEVALELVKKHQARQDGNAIRQIVPRQITEQIPSVIGMSDGDTGTAYIDVTWGRIVIPNKDIDEGILLKSDGFPVYNLANVVDDHEMGITHVIRGEEFLPSTPKHVWIYEALGWTKPTFVHLPLILDRERKKLSKRAGDVAVRDFLDQGYLPEALLNFVALLGWNPKSEQEIFSLNELIEQFSFEGLNKAGAIFDLDKLDWFNAQYIRKMEPGQILKLVDLYPGHDLKKYPKEFLLNIVKLEQERLKKLSEIGDRVKYFFEEPEYDSELLIWKKSDKQTIKQNLERLLEFLQSNDPTEEKIKKFIENNDIKTGEVLWPLRVALTGLEASPGPFEIIEAFLTLPKGKEIVLKRIEKAAKKLQ